MTERCKPAEDVPAKRVAVDSRADRRRTCSHCGELGHTTKTCKQFLRHWLETEA